MPRWSLAIGDYPQKTRRIKAFSFNPARRLNNSLKIQPIN